MKQKMKILALNFQRNGVSGNPFFAVITENLSDTKGKFLITFETKGDNDDIDIQSCRVVMLEGIDKPFYECWRGDTIARELQIQLESLRIKNKVKTWYDLKCLLHNKATVSKLIIEHT